MTDWTAYRANMAQNVKTLASLTPNTLKGLQTLETPLPEKKHLDDKTRELIALAVAVTTRCDGCLGVAVALNAGAALVYSSRVMEAFEDTPE